MRRFMTQEEFLQTQGDACPNLDCPGGDEPSVDGGFVEIDGGYAAQEMSCAWCGAQWTIRFELSGYTLDYEGDKNEADLS
ncbi:MAG: hypothetical protein ABIH46_13960 [Chloroflexota bacterium]